ncbi:MAG TPA: EI24 domain-containing protein [Egibacteraceae bacterium]|nr:EI24 domain-containing protein [Egibacteraceae bacterium]
MIALLHGAAYPLRALGVLRATPRLWRYVAVPILVNLVVAAVLYTVLLMAGLRAVDRLVAGLTGPAALLGAVLRLAVVVSLLVVVGLLLARLGIVLGAPWYGRLSERLETMLLGAPAPAQPLTARGVVGDLGRALGFEARKLALVATVGLGLLLANLLPVAGQLVAAAGGLGLGALVSCLDFFDGPLERRRWTFRAKLAYVRRALPASAGFGLACVALLAVPLLNLLAIPLCVAAGTLFVCERRPLLPPPPR